MNSSLGVPRSTISWKFLNWEPSRNCPPRFNISWNCSIWGARKKFKLFVVDVQGPSSHQLGRPPGRLKGGVWGGGSPPSEKKVQTLFWLSKLCQVLDGYFKIAAEAQRGSRARVPNFTKSGIIIDRLAIFFGFVAIPCKKYILAFVSTL